MAAEDTLVNPFDFIHTSRRGFLKLARDLSATAIISLLAGNLTKSNSAPKENLQAKTKPEIYPSPALLATLSPELQAFAKNKPAEFAQIDVRASMALMGHSEYDTAIIRSRYDVGMETPPPDGRVSSLVNQQQAMETIFEYHTKIEKNPEFEKIKQWYMDQIVSKLEVFDQKTLDLDHFDNKEHPIPDPLKLIFSFWNNPQTVSGGFSGVNGHAIIFGPFGDPKFKAESYKVELAQIITHELYLHFTLGAPESAHAFMGLHELVAERLAGKSDRFPLHIFEAWQVMEKGGTSVSELIQLTSRAGIGDEQAIDQIRSVYNQNKTDLDPDFDSLASGPLPSKLLPINELNKYIRVIDETADIAHRAFTGRHPQLYSAHKLIPHLEGWGPNGEIVGNFGTLDIRDSGKNFPDIYNNGIYRQMAMTFAKNSQGYDYQTKWDFNHALYQSWLKNGRPTNVEPDKWQNILEDISPNVAKVWDSLADPKTAQIGQ